MIFDLKQNILQSSILPLNYLLSHNKIVRNLISDIAYSIARFSFVLKVVKSLREIVEIFKKKKSKIILFFVLFLGNSIDN